MTSQTFFLLFIPILAFILLAVNIIFAPHNPYQEKDSAFECGFHSFLGQNRSEFNISFFVFALLFLLFDLEILLVYPYVVSGYVNGVFGLVIMLIFFLVLTLGFAFEIGKGALSISSKQTYVLNDEINKKTKVGKPEVKFVNTPKYRKIQNDIFHTTLNTPSRRLYSTQNTSKLLLYIKDYASHFSHLALHKSPGDYGLNPRIIYSYY